MTNHVLYAILSIQKEYKKIAAGWMERQRGIYRIHMGCVVKLVR